MEGQALRYVPDKHKTEEICNKAIENDPYNLKFVPDRFKTQKMCDQAVKEDSSSLKFVPDWFVTREWMLMQYDDYYDDDEDKFFKWYDGYQKRTAQKAEIKEGLALIVWHPLRWWDWCMPEDEKKETEKLQA